MYISCVLVVNIGHFTAHHIGVTLVYGQAAGSPKQRTSRLPAKGNTCGDQVQSPAKAGSLQQVAQVGIQTSLDYLHRRRLHNLSGQSLPVFCRSDSKEVLLCISMELAHCAIVACHQKESSPINLTLTL